MHSSPDSHSRCASRRGSALLMALQNYWCNYDRIFTILSHRATWGLDTLGKFISFVKISVDGDYQRFLFIEVRLRNYNLYDENRTIWTFLARPRYTLYETDFVAEELNQSRVESKINNPWLEREKRLRDWQLYCTKRLAFVSADEHRWGLAMAKRVQWTVAFMMVEISLSTTVHVSCMFIENPMLMQRDS